MILLGLSGKARSGKDTLADELVKSHGWVKYNLALALKLKTAQEFDLKIEQTLGPDKDHLDERYGLTPRSILIDMGKFYRSVDPNYWIKKLQRAILRHPQAQIQKAVIADIRFLNEVKWIKDHGGFMARLNRPVEMRGFELEDTSETELDTYDAFDLVVPESRNVDMKDVPALAQWVSEKVDAFYAKKIA